MYQHQNKYGVLWAVIKHKLYLLCGALDEENNGLQGMTAPKLERLRLKNMYDKQSSSHDGLDDETTI